MSTNFTDLLYKEDKGVATITINRPKVLNAFSAHTVEELIQAFLKAGWNKADRRHRADRHRRPRLLAPAATSRRTSAATRAAAPTACRSRSCSR